MLGLAVMGAVVLAYSVVRPAALVTPPQSDVFERTVSRWKFQCPGGRCTWFRVAFECVRLETCPRGSEGRVA